FLLLKEIITGSDKPFPDGIHILVWNNADAFPLFLYIDHLLCGFSPLLAFFQCFSPFTEEYLLPQVLLHLIAERFVEFIFGPEKEITGSTVTFVNLGIPLTGYISDLTPLGLNLQHLLHLVVPVP